MPIVDAHLGSPEHTAAFGAALAGVLRRGDVVLLDGELGAGKTTLVHAVARAMGVPPGVVSSPTFTVMQEYETDRGFALLHLDAYRLGGDDEEELLQLGWDRAREDGAAALIEWGGRLAGLLGNLLDDPPARLRLTHEGETERRAVLEAPEAWAAREHWAALEHAARGSVFASDREQWADLYRWMSGSYRISRPLNPDDLER